MTNEIQTTAKAHHGYITHTSYTLRWERRFGIIWIVTR